MDAIFSVAVVELVRLTLLALFLERALALVFETKLWKRRLDGRGLSPLVAFAVSVWVCTTWGVDAISAVAAAGTSSATAPYREGGAVLTAMIIAGGSKLVMALWSTVTRICASGP